MPSLLRDFSAPVILEYDYTDAELLHLFSHDSDPFNRWEAGQRLAMARLLTLTGATAAAGEPHAAGRHLHRRACARVLTDDTLDAGLPRTGAAAAVRNHDRRADGRGRSAGDPHGAPVHARAPSARACASELLAQYHANQTPGEYSPDAAVGRQARAEEPGAVLPERGAGRRRAIALAQQQFDEADNMTDRVAALARADPRARAGRRSDALQRFYDEFEDEALVIDKWFAMQAVGADHRRGRRAQADDAPGLQPAQPEPRAQPGLHLLRRQPGRSSTPPTAAATRSGPSR